MKYNFRCTKCKKIIVVEHPIKDPHPDKHAECNGELLRIFDPIPFIFKVSGFYKTDSVLSDATEDERLAAEFTGSY